MTTSAKRVLLLYISEVSGHKRATQALETALKRLDPDVEIKSINAFGYTTPITEKIINHLYMGVIKRTPQIWKYLYDNPSVIKNTYQIKRLIHKFNSPKLKQLIDKFSPHCIVCTQAYPCGMVADCKKTYNIPTPLIGVLTDFAPHSFWLYDTVDYYIVPAESVRERFIQKGVNSSKIIHFGIPIDPKFVDTKNKQEIIKKLGLEPENPVVLIMGGGQGLGPIKKIVKQALNVPIDLQLIVICGVNKRLLKWLNKNNKKFSKKVIAFEFVNNIEELMEAASLIVTKPGGLTTAESLSKGLPLVVVNPIPGQEVANAEFLVDKQAAVKVNRLKDFPDVLTRLLTDKEKLAQMSFFAREISRPKAAIDIASLVLKLCSS